MDHQGSSNICAYIPLDCEWHHAQPVSACVCTFWQILDLSIFTIVNNKIASTYILSIDNIPNMFLGF